MSVASLSTIEQASVEGNMDEVIRLLRDPRVDPSDNGNLAICLASEHGHLTVVEQLILDPRVDPSANKNLAIRLASEHGHVSIVDRLLQDPRVDPSLDQEFRTAAKEGDLAVVERMLGTGINPSADDNHALRLASYCGHTAVVYRLLRDERVLAILDVKKHLIKKQTF